MMETGMLEPTGQTFPREGHDHGHCVHEALERAQRLCEERGVRLTEVRRQVLELVWQSHRPIGAYEILELLAASRGRTAPPTVYRALEFLGAQGLIHRIDSRNAFVGCAGPAQPHKACFLICTRCGDAAEIADAELDQALARIAGRAGFTIEMETVELSGLCARCRGRAAG